MLLTAFAEVISKSCGTKMGMMRNGWGVCA